MDHDDVSPTATFVEELPLDLIDMDSDQVRSNVEDSLGDLPASAAENGVIQPVLCERLGKRYLLLDGARRFLASRKAGRKTISAVIRPSGLSSGDRYLQQLIANSHREDLNPIDLCNAYRRVMEELQMNATMLAKKLSKSKTYVSNVLSLANLPESAKAMIADGRIGLANAVLLARLSPDDLQIALEKARSGVLKRAELEQSAAKKGRKDKEDGKGESARLNRIAFETPAATIAVLSRSKPSLEDVIETLQDLVRSCKRARHEGLDLATLVSVLRDKGRKARDVEMADAESP